MKGTELTVAIVGAGLAGCALALGLRRIGARVILLEKRPPIMQTDGTGILLVGNATAALDALGCGKELQALGRPVETIAFTDECENPLFEIDCRRHAWPPFFAVRHALLRSMLLRESGIEPLFNTTIQSVEDTDRPTLRLSDGSRIACDLLVGADGIYSTVRQLVFRTPAPTCVDDYRGFRFITTCPSSLRQPRYFVGNGATLLLYPLLNGELYCGAGPVSPARFLAAPSPTDTLKAIFADFEGVAREVMDGLNDSIEFLPTRYWHIEQDQWVHNRCLLIGDAAHASPPTLAQGGAMAFEDASVLTQCLAENSDIDLALVQYEERRRNRVAAVQHASLERMDATRQVSQREHQIRKIAARNFGEYSLEQPWGGLISEAP